MWRRREHRGDVDKQNPLFLDERRDSGLPQLLALPSLWDGSNKARLCGVRGTRGGAAICTTAANHKTTSWISWNLRVEFPFCPHNSSPHSTTDSASTAAVSAVTIKGVFIQILSHMCHVGIKMDSRDLLDLQWTNTIATGNFSGNFSSLQDNISVKWLIVTVHNSGSWYPCMHGCLQTHTLEGVCVCSHLTFSIYARIQRVISARCSIHHGWSALCVEVVSFCQAVERAGFHPTWTHAHTHTHETVHTVSKNTLCWIHHVLIDTDWENHLHGMELVFQQENKQLNVIISTENNTGNVEYIKTLTAQRLTCTWCSD